MSPWSKAFFRTWIVAVAGAALVDANGTFRAAVYEHVFRPSSVDPVETMLENLRTYEQRTTEAAAQGAQIIVFPEVGIVGLDWDARRDVYYQVVPDPKEGPEVPCSAEAPTNEKMVAYHLSCMAKANRIVVVANFPTRVSCNNSNAVANASCPDRGEYRFNTNAAFDANGTVMALYHKLNLYQEPQYDQPPTVQRVYFDTEFGRFGLVTCFDLLWKEPTVSLVERDVVDTLVFPTAWMDQLPYLASVQAQSAWAAGLRVNLLAANMHHPALGFMGSGLYVGAYGPINYTYGTNHSDGLLLLGDLPCRRESPPPPPLPTSPLLETVVLPVLTEHRIKHQNLSEFVGIPLLDAMGDVQLCQGSLCCQVAYETIASATSAGKYVLVVRQGPISENDIYAIDAEICSVLWCRDEKLSSCATGPADVDVSLTRLRLWGNFSTPHLYPSILSDDLRLVSADRWYFQAETDLCQPESSDPGVWCPLIGTNANTTTTSISIYGRRYDLDETPYPT